jgi:tRNA(Ile)-lysidine synthase
MLNRFRHIVEEMRGLIDDSRSASCLLAVSGGVDSMCLADLWVRAFGSDSCAIAHCNFNLRGEESDADEALVTMWAQSHGVRLHKTSFDTVRYASENGQSIEMAARELRYRWFGQLCREHGHKAVVVAHHADDNAETLVLNMVRGAGLKGFTGMKSMSSLPLSFRPSEASGEIYLLRPLLTFTRKQIEGHVFAWKVPYREDRTNASVEYRRNSIRHEVFPLFERMNPSYVRTLNREMTYLKDASTIVECWCREHAAKVLCHPERSEGSVRLDVPALLAIPQWRYLLYYILEPYGFNSATLESIEALLMSDRTVSGKRFESEEYILRMERGHMIVSRKIAGQAGNDATPVIPGLTGDPFTVVRGPGAYHHCGQRITVEVLPWNSGMTLKQPEGVLIFDAAKLTFPFVMRSWRNGDWMIPLGMKGKKKLSDLFADLKYDSAQKSSAIVIVDTKGDYAEQQHVAGVVPVRLDDHYKVTPSTKEIIRITITDNQ